MRFRTDKDILRMFAMSIGMILVGIALCLLVPFLFFIGGGFVLGGMIITVMTIYVSSRPKEQFVPDERTNKNMYRAGYNAFWIVLLVIAILNMFEFVMPTTIKYMDASTIILLMGVYSFLIFRWFYNRKGDV